jgi:hypothetical protein
MTTNILNTKPIKERKEKTTNSFISFFLINCGASQAKIATKIRIIIKNLDIFNTPCKFFCYLLN